MNNTETKTETDISLHEEYMQAAFESVLAAEKELAEAEGELSKAKAFLGTKKSIAEGKVIMAWKAVKELMDETGETEVMLPAGNGTWYKIYYTAPRQSLEVDEDAVPDEWVKVERKPKLLEIKEYLKSQESLPNWAHYKTGESKLAWRNVKKGAI